MVAVAVTGITIVLSPVPVAVVPSLRVNVHAPDAVIFATRFAVPLPQKVVSLLIMVAVGAVMSATTVLSVRLLAAHAPTKEAIL